MKEVNTSKAPSALGPYSQAIVSGNLVFLSGQLGINPITGEFVGDDIQSQTKQCLINAQNILKELNLDLTNVVKTTVLLSDIKNFVKMNEEYACYFESPYPARAAFEVANLPKYAQVEIEMIVEIKNQD
jgi:2-iminobutanoate/2-iminopropanoate deaminase